MVASHSVVALRCDVASTVTLPTRIQHHDQIIMRLKMATMRIISTQCSYQVGRTLPKLCWSRSNSNWSHHISWWRCCDVASTVTLPTRIQHHDQIIMRLEMATMRIISTQCSYHDDGTVPKLCWSRSNSKWSHHIPWWRCAVMLHLR